MSNEKPSPPHPQDRLGRKATEYYHTDCEDWRMCKHWGVDDCLGCDKYLPRELDDA